MEYIALPGYVKKMQKQYRLRQVDLSEKSGVGLRFVRELEQGKQSLRMDKVNNDFEKTFVQSGLDTKVTEKVIVRTVPYSIIQLFSYFFTSVICRNESSIAKPMQTASGYCLA